MLLAQQNRDKPVTGQEADDSNIPRGPVTTVETAENVTTRRTLLLTGKKMDLCPLCNSRHFYKKQWTKVDPPHETQMLLTHLSSCPKLAELSPAQREKTVADQSACTQCSSWDHTKHKLPGRAPAGETKCKHKMGSVVCGAKHGPWYHEALGGSATTGSILAACSLDHEQISRRKSGLYEVYSVAVPDIAGCLQTGTFLVDPGLDTNSIRHDYAAKLGLQGVQYSYYLKVVDMEYMRKESARYKFDVTDRYGAVHHVSALGFNSINSLPDEPDLQSQMPLLGHLPLDILERHRGTVDILLGLGSSFLHGKTRQEWGNLRVLESRFGCGWVLLRYQCGMALFTTSQPLQWSSRTASLLEPAL